MNNPFRIENEKDRRLVILGVVFVIFAAIIFSWQISSSPETTMVEIIIDDNVDEPVIPGTQQELNSNIINAKKYLEDISIELESIANLL